MNMNMTLTRCNCVLSCASISPHLHVQQHCCIVNISNTLYGHLFICLGMKCLMLINTMLALICMYNSCSINMCACAIIHCARVVLIKKFEAFSLSVIIIYKMMQWLIHSGGSLLALLFLSRASE